MDSLHLHIKHTLDIKVYATVPGDNFSKLTLIGILNLPPFSTQRFIISIVAKLIEL